MAYVGGVHVVLAHKRLDRERVLRLLESEKRRGLLLMVEAQLVRLPACGEVNFIPHPQEKINGI